ncbi:MAG: hypothetical protein WB762_01790 [Candidatus Sulfotelmatobacter sp.]
MAKAKPILRMRTVSTKVTEEEFFGLEAQATERGVNLSEWVRETLLASVNGQEPRAATGCAGTGQVALMAELSALRAILLNVLFRQSNGERLTAEEMQRLVDRADSDKIEEGEGAALAGARVTRTTERKILILLWFRVPSSEWGHR